MKKITWGLLVGALLVALGLGLYKVQAQISQIQPFTAIETHITRNIEPQVPIVYTRVLAVSGDGQLIAQIQQSQLTTDVVNTRTVVNKTARTKITIDPAAKMLIVHPYHEDGSLTAGANCEGTSDGRIEGFDLHLFELPLEHTSDGETITPKRWAAPKLGCYILRAESLWTDKDGKFVRLIVSTLSEIKIGEPDPSYFDVSLPEGYTQGKPEDYKGVIVNGQKALRALQPQ